MMQISMPPLHPGQRLVWDHGARFQVLACGRRWGKTRLGALRCVYTAVNGRRAWWVAPSYPMASIGWRVMQRLARQVPGAVLRQMDRLITMPGGGTVQVRSADNPDSLRGEGLDFVVMDECAFIREEAWTEALRPALADRQGRAYFISTPKGRNWFWRAWLTGEQDGQVWRSWHFPTSDNPHIAAEEIEAARAGLPEMVFRQEFMAEFMDDAGGVFRRVMEAATAPGQAGPLDGHQYLMGVDWGKHNDWTVLTVLDTTANEVAFLDRFNQIDYVVQTNRLRALAERFKPARIIAEANSMGEPLIEQLRRMDLPVQPFTMTNATKASVIEGLALALERGELRLLPDPALVGELQAFEMERLKSGLMSYGAPAGMHDDCVISLALAWSGAQRRSVRLGWA